MSDDVRADARRRAGLNLDPIQRKWDAWNEYRLPNSELLNMLSFDVPQLIQEVKRERSLATQLLTELDRNAQREAERDAALAVIAQVRDLAADVDQDGGHSGPSLARTILNIIGGEA